MLGGNTPVKINEMIINDFDNMITFEQPQLLLPGILCEC